MTELYKDPAERRPVQHDQDLATVTDRTVPALAMPNYATTDVDPTPGSPRPLAATEPNYATTDVDPTPGSPRPVAATEPNYATTDVDPTPGSPRPVAATEPNYATTDVDPTPGSPRPDDGQDLSGSAAHPAVGTVRLNTTPDRGR